LFSVKVPVLVSSRQDRKVYKVCVKQAGAERATEVECLYVCGRRSGGGGVGCTVTV